ncbi:WD40-repeat-containing domain protein [Dipodascopsis uninucleata]
MTTQQGIIPRYAHTPGLTRLAYSATGKYLLTVGTNQIVRRFTVGKDEEEPESVEQHESAIVGLATSREKFATCSLDGTASLFTMATAELETTVFRQTMPIRDISFSADGHWLAIAGDETTVRIINSGDITQTLVLGGHRQGVKHVSFHPNGVLIATTSIDGTVRIYSISTEEPELIKAIDKFTTAVEPDSEVCTKVAWHPDGQTFAIQNKAREIVLISRTDWAVSSDSSHFGIGVHEGWINDYSWSPNGRYLATAGADDKIVVWDSRSREVVRTLRYGNVINLAWHPTANTLSFTTNQGQLYTIPEVIASHMDAPIGLDRESNFVDTVTKRTDTSKHKIDADEANSDVLAEQDMFNDDDDDLEAWMDEDLEADDDQGNEDLRRRKDGPELYDYDGPHRSKRIMIDEADDFSRSKKRFTEIVKRMQHEPFQPGSTPWRNGRRYLALNSVGYIWTVEGDMHNTVTVSFFDRGRHREYHFTDHFQYDKACLTEDSALFASHGSDGQASRIFFRTHESGGAGSWDAAFAGEKIESIGLSATMIVACSSKGYVRVFDIHGTPVRMYRQSGNPVVCCASWQDYVMIVRNIPDGSGRLVYSVENIKTDETLQKNDTVDIGTGSRLVSVLFSSEGDPCIYDSDGVLSVLVHWRRPMQSKWVPLLDTRLLGRDNPGESFWPLGVIGSKFNCIILKNGEKYPYIPLPISTEFDIRMPIYPNIAKSDKDDEIKTLEEQYLRMNVLLSLYEENLDICKSNAKALSDGNSSRSSEDYEEEERHLEISRKQLGIDKILLQLVQQNCKKGNDGKASNLVTMLHNEQAIKAAGKIAQRYERIILAERINRMLEI